MAALTATDWSVTINNKHSPGGNKIKHHECKLTLATAGSYPSAGIPIPNFGKLGFVRNVDYIQLFDNLASSTSYIVKYDGTTKTIRVYTTTASTGTHAAEVATTVTVGAGSFVIYVDAVGW